MKSSEERWGPYLPFNPDNEYPDKEEEEEECIAKQQAVVLVLVVSVGTLVCVYVCFVLTNVLKL